MKNKVTPPKLNNSTATNTMILKWMKSQRFKKMVVKIINEIKEDMNKCLNEFQENSINEIKNTM
jgi:hypothetical protein